MTKDKPKKPTQKNKLEKKGMQISQRIIFSFTFIITGLVAVILILFFRTVSFNDRYQSLLQNVSSLNYIKTQANSQAARIVNLCYAGSEEDPQELITIQTMLADIDMVYENMGTDATYDSSRKQVESMKRQLVDYQTSYQSALEKGDGAYSSKGVEDAENMASISSLLIIDCNTLLESEINRSNEVQQQINVDFQRVIRVLLILFFCIFFLCILMLLSLLKSIVKPIRILKKKMSNVAEGDLSGDIITIKQRDEFGVLGRQFNIMFENLRSIITKVCDIGKKIRSSSSDVCIRIQDNTNKSMEITNSIEDMKEHMMLEQSQSRNSLQQVDSIQTVTEHIVESSERISQNANEAMNLATNGTVEIHSYLAQLEQVNRVITSVANTAGLLSQKSKEMEQILKTIEDISEQTNLLSLNATIEAARAGESGRGFAVVATQIHKLSSDTQSAAGEIGQIIQDVQSHTIEMNTKMQDGLSQLTHGNVLADNLKDHFENIKTGTLTVNKDIQTIRVDLTSLSGQVGHIVSSMNEIDQTIDENIRIASSVTDRVNEESSNMQEVQCSTDGLTGLIGELEQLVSKFSL